LIDDAEAPREPADSREVTSVSKPTLDTDKTNSIGGLVLTSQGSGWKRPTGVFLPDPSIVADRGGLTVLLWFHGYYVKDIPALFYKEDTKILRAVLDSKKHLVVVAPHLGWFKSATDTDYNASVLGGGKACEQYLNQVLDALADWYLTTLIDIDLESKPRPKFQIAELYIGGHSGGGGGIMTSVNALGSYKEQLRECWGFDCLYGSGQTWYEWARARSHMPLYFYFGQGTKPAFRGDVLGLWRRAYGTLKKPLPLGARMLNLYLAPALQGTEFDSVAFQFSEDIAAKRAPANRYEEIRKQVDPFLDDTTTYWSKIIALGLKDHYPVVSELLGPRIKQSLL
jgi:hypothetical protein